MRQCERCGISRGWIAKHMIGDAGACADLCGPCSRRQWHVGNESIPALRSVIREQAQEIEELARRLEIVEGVADE